MQVEHMTKPMSEFTNEELALHVHQWRTTYIQSMNNIADINLVKNVPVLADVVVQLINDVRYVLGIQEELLRRITKNE